MQDPAGGSILSAYVIAGANPGEKMLKGLSDGHRDRVSRRGTATDRIGWTNFDSVVDALLK